MKNITTLLPPSDLQTETMVVDGVSVRLNFPTKQNIDAFENIRKTLLQSHQMGKKMARIQ